MAIVKTDDRHYNAIAEKIRELSGRTDMKMSPALMSEGVGYVYEAAFDEGSLDGEETERERFWNVYQQNGQRIIYDYAFAGGAAWTDEIFAPKHNIAPRSAANMFTKTGITDLKGRLETLGVTLDFSKCTTVSNLFNSATAVKYLPKIDLSSATNYASAFGWASQIVSIDEVVFNPKATTVTNMFAGCTRLVDIAIGGTIATSGVDFTSCQGLSKNSLTSIINALSGTTSNLTITVSMGAVINAFGALNAAEWTTLVNSKPNWTITAV